MSMFTGFVIADFDSFKKQRKSKSASPIKQLRHQSLFQVFCIFVVQKHFKDVRAQKFPRTDFFKTLTAGRK